MADKSEVDIFIDGWQEDPLHTKDAFVQYRDFLRTLPRKLEFKARPGISYSLRGKSSQPERDVFALVDVVDDEPESRWLSVCFYADLVTDPDEKGDWVPEGLNGKDAICFNLDEDDPAMRTYILDRLREAARNDPE